MILKYLGIAVLTLCLCCAMRAFMPGITPFVVGTAGILVLSLCIGENKTGLDYYYSLCADTGYGEYFKVMLKGLGVGVISGIGCDLCRDCGEEQLVSRLEFAAKTEILMLSLPLVKSIIETGKSILIS